MKSVRRIISIILVLCMLTSAFAFAETPKASLASPVENSVLADDSLLVSVKVLDKKKISVSVFEEKEFTGLDKDKKDILKSIDTKDFTSDILKAFSSEYSKTYKLVEKPVYKTGNVIASFSFGEEKEKQVFKEVVVAEPTSYTGSGEVGCFTKKLEKLNPGVYKIQIEVLDKDDKVEETYTSFIALQEKPAKDKDKAETKAVPVEAAKTNLVQSLIKFIKSIVK